MREINTQEITKKVKELFIEANYSLPEDVCAAIDSADKKESDALAKEIFCEMKNNLSSAKEINVPVCQDTGMAVLLVEIGQDVHVVGGDFTEAVNEGVRQAYTEGYLRKSVVRDPLFDRVNTNDNTPAVVHTEIVPGDKIKLTSLPKGFGSENMSAVKMFTPSATKEDIIGFICDVLLKAGGNPCPPVVIGVGIGGTFDYAPYLAKKALARPLDRRNTNPEYAEMEEELLSRINSLGIGPQGFGGDISALSCNIETYPTHIAGLPVAVNVNCHVMRRKSTVI